MVQPPGGGERLPVNDYEAMLRKSFDQLPQKPSEEQNDKAKKNVYQGFDLRLMSAVLNDVSGILTEGKDLIIVAAVNHVLHFRIFDGDGKVVVDTDERS